MDFVAFLFTSYVSILEGGSTFIPPSPFTPIYAPITFTQSPINLRHLFSLFLSNMWSWSGRRIITFFIELFLRQSPVTFILSTCFQINELAKYLKRYSFPLCKCPKDSFCYSYCWSWLGEIAIGCAECWPNINMLWVLSISVIHIQRSNWRNRQEINEEKNDHTVLNKLTLDRQIWTTEVFWFRVVFI